MKLTSWAILIMVFLVFFNSLVYARSDIWMEIDPENSHVVCNPICKTISFNIINQNESITSVALEYTDEEDNGITFSVSRLKTFRKFNSTFIDPLDIPLQKGGNPIKIKISVIDGGKYSLRIFNRNTNETYHVVDPWFNSTYLNRISFNISNPENIEHLYENITINFTGVVGGECENNSITFGNDSITETNQKFGFLANTSNSCLYVFAYNTSASQSGNVTAGYLYYNISNTSATPNIETRFGKFFIVYDDFEDGVFNTTMWIKGTTPANVNEFAGGVHIQGTTTDWKANMRLNGSNTIGMTQDLNYTFTARIKASGVEGNFLGYQLINTTSEANPYDNTINYTTYCDHFTDSIYVFGSRYANYPLLVANNYYWIQYRTNSTGIHFKTINGSSTEWNFHTINNTGSRILNPRFANSWQNQTIDYFVIYNTSILMYQNKSTVYLSVPEYNGTVSIPLVNGTPAIPSFEITQETPTTQICINSSYLNVSKKIISCVGSNCTTYYVYEEKLCPNGCYIISNSSSWGECAPSFVEAGFNLIYWFGIIISIIVGILFIRWLIS